MGLTALWATVVWQHYISVKDYALSRVDRLLRTATPSQQLVEIGAGYSPIAPKSGGWNTHVIDHASRDELRAKYAGASVDTRAIEDVDTVWREGALHDAVPPRLIGHVDMIIASHVLEHMPDLIGFFSSASRLVAPGGALSIALPDKRYCFDCYKPTTTTGDLLDAHRRGACRHSLKTAFNHVAYSATVDGQLAWAPRPITPPVLLDSFARAAATAACFNDDETRPYEDYHAWHFTAASFELALMELNEVGLADWHLEALEGPENFEFFALLRRGRGVQLDSEQLKAKRRQLLIDQLTETREQIDFMLGRSEHPRSVSEPERAEHLAAKLAQQDIPLRLTSKYLATIRLALRSLRSLWRGFRK